MLDMSRGNSSDEQDTCVHICPARLLFAWQTSKTLTYDDYAVANKDAESDTAPAFPSSPAPSSSRKKYHKKHHGKANSNSILPYHNIDTHLPIIIRPRTRTDASLPRQCKLCLTFPDFMLDDDMATVSIADDPPALE